MSTDLSNNLQKSLGTQTNFKIFSGKKYTGLDVAY